MPSYMHSHKPILGVSKSSYQCGERINRYPKSMESRWFVPKSTNMQSECDKFLWFPNNCKKKRRALYDRCQLLQRDLCDSHSFALSRARLLIAFRGVMQTCTPKGPIVSMLIINCEQRQVFLRGTHSPAPTHPEKPLLYNKQTMR